MFRFSLISFFLFSSSSPLGSDLSRPRSVLGVPLQPERFNDIIHLGDREPGGGWHGVPDDKKSPATVEKVWSALSKFSSRSSASELLHYSCARLVSEHLTMPYFMDPFLRYFRLRRYANTMRTEDNWINSLCDLYGGGNPDNIVVVVGDWCADGLTTFRTTRRPAAYAHLLHRMRVAGIPVFLVNEAYTSKRCSHCKSLDSVCSGDGIHDTLVGHGRSRHRYHHHSHGRVICSLCGRLYNRDVNASENILHLATALLTSGERPKYLSKGVSN